MKDFPILNLKLHTYHGFEFSVMEEEPNRVILYVNTIMGNDEYMIHLKKDELKKLGKTLIQFSEILEGQE